MLILLFSLRVKEEDREYKKKIKVTGGGPAPPPPKATEEIALAASMMQADLAMGNNVYESFTVMPAIADCAPDVLALDDEGNFSVNFSTLSMHNINVNQMRIKAHSLGKFLF